MIRSIRTLVAAAALATAAAAAPVEAATETGPCEIYCAGTFAVCLFATGVSGNCGGWLEGCLYGCNFMK
jgi:hypothetical protein